METEFSIQQVAEKTGLSIDTLRYYERIGLIARVSRAVSGHRRYTQQNIDWINLLIRLRKTGMPISQMLHYARLCQEGPQTVTERRILLEHHQQELERQMHELDEHMAALQRKITRYKEKEAQQAPSPPIPLIKNTITNG